MKKILYVNLQHKIYVMLFTHIRSLTEGKRPEELVSIDIEKVRNLTTINYGSQLDGDEINIILTRDEFNIVKD